MPNRDLTLTLNVKPGTTSGVGQMLAGAGKQLAQGTGLGDQFGQAIHRQQEQLNFMRFASSPDAIRRQAVQTLRMQDARERYEQRMQDELQKLRPGFGDKGKGGSGWPQMAGFIGSAAGGNVLGGAIGMAGPWGAVIAGVVEGLSKLWGFLKNSVGLANPGAMTRYQIAWDDLHAVIGHKLVPVIDAATDAVRLFADTIKDAIPGIGQMNATQRRAAGLGMASLVSGPLGMVGGVRWAAELLGLAKPGSSIGAAARPAQFTSLDEYSKRAYRESYSGGPDPAQETASNTGSIRDTVNEILAAIRGAPSAATAALQGLQ